MQRGSLPIPFPMVVFRPIFSALLVIRYGSGDSWPLRLLEKPPHPPKASAISFKDTWLPPSLLAEAVLLQWKTPLLPPPFLLPYSLIPFLCHYLYRKDQQFPNNGIKSAKLLKSFIEY